MRKDIAGPETESTMPLWEGLEGVVREKATEFIQQILEEEVTELLGREKSKRREAVDASPGYRNGYGKARRLSMSSGTITVRRPRVRGLEERFESRVLPLFARRTKEVGELIPELYLHGLAEGDFELALRGLLGEGAPLSKASIRRLRAVWSSGTVSLSCRRSPPGAGAMLISVTFKPLDAVAPPRAGGADRNRRGLPRRVKPSLPIPTKSSTHSERSRPPVPGQAVHRFRSNPDGFARSG